MSCWPQPTAKKAISGYKLTELFHWPPRVFDASIGHAESEVVASAGWLVVAPVDAQPVIVAVQEGSDRAVPDKQDVAIEIARQNRFDLDRKSVV